MALSSPQLRLKRRREATLRSGRRRLRRAQCICADSRAEWGAADSRSPPGRSARGRRTARGGGRRGPGARAGFLGGRQGETTTGDRNGEREEGDIADLAATATAGADHHVGEQTLQGNGNRNIGNAVLGEGGEGAHGVFQGPLLLQRVVDPVDIFF